MERHRQVLEDPAPISAFGDPHRINGPVPLPSRAVAGLRHSILSWYRAHGRMLRIRTTTDPWAVLVAETMAHQTQIERVDAAWAAFLDRFPSPRALADAGPGEAVRAWQGLGYNRRADNLYRAVQSSDPGSSPRA